MRILRVPWYGVILVALSTVSCATHQNSVAMHEGLVTPLDAQCVQDVIRELPGNRPSLEPSRWYTNVLQSGNLASTYAFGLPDISDLPGPTGDASYWVHLLDVSESFFNDRYGLFFLTVVWTEPYPQSQARAALLQGSLANVKARVHERCGGQLKEIQLPSCEWRYEDGATIITTPCASAASPSETLRPTEEPSGPP